nr:hypothetical protein [Tanacetum cinerariifolium]
MSDHNNSGLALQSLMTFEHNSSSLGLHCQMTFEHNSSSLGPHCQMTSDHNSSDLALQSLIMFEHISSSLGPHCQMTFEHSSSSLGPHCQMTSDHNSSGLALQSLMTFEHKKKSVCFSVLYLQERKEIFLFLTILINNDIFSHARSLYKWTNLIDFSNVHMTSEQHGSGLGLHQLTPGYISLGLVQNLISPTPYVPPSKKDYEILFQPLFDEYFNPPPRAVSPDSVVVAAARVVDLAVLASNY